jgi:hypothetical protein
MHPIALLVKDHAPRKYPKNYWRKYDEWVYKVSDYNRGQYEIDYWSMKCHQCCTQDIKYELLYGIIISE